MRVIAAMAAIPVATFAIWPTHKTPEIVATAAVIEIEGVRAARQDDSTFGRRFDPVISMPPAMEVRYARDGGVASTVPATPAPATQPAASRGRLRSRPARLDLCQRHRMHKVFYGRTWRCRR